MSSKKIILKSSDGEMFEVDEAVAMESKTIKHMMEDDYTANGIPLPKVTGKILAKVIEYCKTHLEADDKKFDEKDDLEKWDAAFVKVDRSTLFELTLAAYYLKIKSLVDLTCKTVANTMIKDKSVEEIRETFQIQNDFTPEEEAAIRKEIAWLQ